MKPLIVSIAGKARHGKDTFAKYLKEGLEIDHLKVQILHFADGVKEEAKEEGWNGEKDKEGRTLLQKLGHGRRNADINYWIKKAESKIKQVDVVLIPDTRYKNEITYWFEHGYKQVSVRVARRDSKTMKEFDNGLTEEQKNHPSETDLDDVLLDYIVFNFGDDDFKDKAEILAGKIAGDDCKEIILEW